MRLRRLARRSASCALAALQLLTPPPLAEAAAAFSSNHLHLRSLPDAAFRRIPSPFSSSCFLSDGLSPVLSAADNGHCDEVGGGWPPPLDSKAIVWPPPEFRQKRERVIPPKDRVDEEGKGGMWPPAEFDQKNERVIPPKPEERNENGGLWPPPEFQQKNERVIPPKPERRNDGSLTDAMRYLDADGAAYVESLAEELAVPAPVPAPVPVPVPSPAEVLPSSSESDSSAAAASVAAARIAELESRLADLQSENASLKSLGRDLLSRFRHIAVQLDKVESRRIEAVELNSRWEKDLLVAEDGFPNEGELESYDWLLRRGR